MPSIHDFGPLQLSILARLWDYGPAPVPEILAEWPDAKAPQHVTVLTVLRRLEARGLVTRERVGRAFVYRAEVSKAELGGALLRDVVARLFNSPGEAIEFLLGEIHGAS